ncbi:hypothetical protein LTR86_008945 [Recurvomyces mirabilis]|nr:hypothetical protein LTR86_008945 [Recurvomyces mirabilis]
MESLETLNRRGQIVTITVGIQLVVTILCLLVRLHMRWPWYRLFSRADALGVTATVLVLGNSVATFVIVYHGMGRPQASLSASTTAALWKMFLSAHLLFYAAAACSIWTVVEFMYQVRGTGRSIHLDLVRGITIVWGLSGVVTMGAFLAVHVANAIRVDLVVLNSLGCALQVATFSAAVHLIWPLQMKTSRKLAVLTGFAPAFAVIATLIASILVTPTAAANQNFTQTSVGYVISTQVSIIFLMISCTAAPLLQIGRHLGSMNIGPIIDGKTNTYGSRGSANHSTKRGTRGHTYDMGPVTRAKLGVGQTRSSVVAVENPYLPDRRANKVRDRDEDVIESDGASVESDNSRRIIIKKTVDLEVVSNAGE